MRPDEAEPFGGWDDGLPVWPDGVMYWWEMFLALEAPWKDAPRDDVFGSMRRILSELLNECRDVDEEDRRIRLLDAARAHGTFRRGQQCSLDNLAYEFETIVDALELALQEAGMQKHLVRDALDGLCPDLRLAHQAATLAWKYHAAPQWHDKRHRFDH